MFIYDIDEEEEIYDEEPFPEEYEESAEDDAPEEEASGADSEASEEVTDSTALDEEDEYDIGEEAYAEEYGDTNTIIYETVKPAEPVKTEVAEVVTTAKRTDSVEYPMLLLETDSMAQHKLIALQSIINAKGKLAASTMYTVYLKCNGKVIKIGVTSNFALRAILSSEVFKDFKKFIKLSADRKIEGNLMYALCGVTI